ncbi:aldo/keto reductase [Algoriphagus pacificus]|uniref:Aldo/keto reductase n=1 Tax=Algoriphagus pacificus TaxID=2811234 RepID=A0ABS3CGX8_9BACT|nr:aldo/keto reductase [Algoriphagus pacificus]MBN7815804.1 aldo/keto reductase [Algoriphagus pacificus]
MKNSTISDSNIQITPIGLGGMSLPEDFETSQKIIDACLDHGINFLDTADLYQGGWNEEMIGKTIQGKRSSVVLATKVGNQLRPDGSGWDWNPRKSYILEAVDKSLKRLQTDFIDLYQLHGGTIEDPWDETLEAFEILKKQGKIKAFGISSIRPNVIRKVLSDSNPATVMMQYSPLDRRPEEEAFPLISTTQTKVLVRGSLAKGMLINKAAGEYLDRTKEEVQAMKIAIQESGFSPEAFLIKFGLMESSVGALIIGASSVSQIEKMAQGYEESMQIPDQLIIDFKEKFSPNYYQQHR